MAPHALRKQHGRNRPENWPALSDPRRSAYPRFPAMEALFKVLGAAVTVYVLYGLVSGAVYAKYRAGGRIFRREENATGYWSAIAAYVVLAALLLLYF